MKGEDEMMMDDTVNNFTSSDKISLNHLLVTYIIIYIYIFFIIALKFGYTSSALPFFRPLPLQLYIFNIM